MSKFNTLDPLLHAPLRLSIISLLIPVEEADFNFLKEETQATSGNLSVQMNKLKDAGYIEIRKRFKGNYPQTLCKITPKGIEAFENYVNNLKKYINVDKKK